MTHLNLPVLRALVVYHYLFSWLFQESKWQQWKCKYQNGWEQFLIKRWYWDSKYVRLVKLSEIINGWRNKSFWFANSEEIRRDHLLFDEWRYENGNTWLHYNFDKKGYLRQICEVLYKVSGAKPGGSRGAWSHNIIFFKDIIIIMPVVHRQPAVNSFWRR